MSAELQNDLILANLALHLGKPNGQRVGDEPTYEELAALADNRLEPVRRAQILSYIANDASIYQRWIQVVQAVTDFSDASDFELQPESTEAQHKRGLVSRIADALFGNSLRAGAFGGGVATAAIALAVLILLAPIDHLSRVNDVYDQWSPDIQAQWESTAHRSKNDPSDSRAFTFRTETQQVLAYGYHSGAVLLGPDKFSSLGIKLDQELGEAPSMPATLSRQQYKLLLLLGKVSALTTLQCDLPQLDKDFSRVYSAVEHLLQELHDVKDPKIAALVSGFPQQPPANQRTAICLFSDGINASIK